jgi:hypothetical protein
LVICRFLMAMLIVLALPPAVARAQSAPSATASAVDECYVGDSVPYRIVVENASDATPPDLEAILGDDWIVRFVGVQPSSSSMTIIINGRVQEQKSQSVTLAYSISPRRAGQLTIPAVDVQTQGRTLRTQPIPIKVSEPTVVQGFGTSVELSRAYVGQAFKLTLSWVLSSPAEDVVFNLNLLPDAFTVHPLAPSASQDGAARQFADVDYLEGPTGGSGGAGGGKVRGTITQASIDGEDRVRVNAEFLLIPRRAGRFECGAARVDYRAVVGQRERSVFDAPWERKTITQRRYAQAPAKSVEVIDLPSAGRPANFSGLVGEFDLDAECQPRQAAVGDPLNLTLVLRSKLPIFDSPTLDLSAQRGGGSSLADLFRVPRDPVLPQIAGNTAIYSAQIRPQSTKIAELPPVEISYFDPAEASYRIARSNRIPLKVAAAPVVGLGALERLAAETDDPALLSDGAAAASAPRPAPERINGFFPPIGDAAPASLAASMPRDGQTLPILLTTLAVPTALWCASALLAVRRRAAERDPASWRRRGALRRAEHALHRRSASDTAAVSAAVRRFVSDWFNLPPDAVTTGDAVSAVESLDPVLASRLRSVLESCDRSLFGPDGAAAAQERLADDAAEIVREIARAPRISRFASQGSGSRGEVGRTA